MSNLYLPICWRVVTCWTLFWLSSLKLCSLSSPSFAISESTAATYVTKIFLIDWNGSYKNFQYKFWSKLFHIQKIVQRTSSSSSFTWTSWFCTDWDIDKFEGSCTEVKLPLLLPMEPRLVDFKLFCNVSTWKKMKKTFSFIYTI